jgi:hypothetical protein
LEAAPTAHSAALLDAPLVLLLCDAWALLRLDHEDWPSVAAGGAFDTVHAVAHRFEVAAVLPGHGGHSGGSSHAAAQSPASAADPRQAGGGAHGKRRSPGGSNDRGAGDASHGAATAAKRAAGRLAQCAAATRSLARLLACRLAQLGVALAPRASAAAAMAGLLAPCFRVLQSDLARSLQLMRPPLPPAAATAATASRRDGTSAAETAPGSASGAAATATPSQQWQAAAGGRASHRRRCQELLTSPRRFLNMEDGLTIPAEQLLHNSKGPDFSLTFWLFLTQDATGKPRAVLTRGSRGERWPCVLLREADRRLEVILEA